MNKKALVLASNVGLWAEELQAPWDALRTAGVAVTLATRTGKKPLPIMVSMDADFIDPLQNYNVNPKAVVDRTKVLLSNGEWERPIKFADAHAADYDAVVIVGGPGAALDIAGNPLVHRLALDAYRQGKVLGALCYAVAAFVWTRDPGEGNRSVIFGRTVTAHPREWDFNMDLSYPLYGATPDNPGTDLTTTGFVFPLQSIVEDAVGPTGKVLSDPTTNRQKPLVAHDGQFVTALSVESSIAFGAKLVQVLAR